MPTTNQQIVQQLFDNYLHGNIPAMFALMDSSIVWIEPGAPEVGWGGTFSGFDGVKKMLVLEAEMLKVTAFNIKNFLTNDTMVTVLGNDSANVVSTGKSYTTEWTMTFTLVNEKITRVETCMDTNAIAKAFLP
jgi:uncharacterized protein